MTYAYPPTSPETADEWMYDNGFAAVAYAAGWTQDGRGYGEQAREEWPACPGFDFEDGVPAWSEINEEDGYEYRTVLYDSGGIPSFPKETDDGWKLVANFRVNPEPELYDESGSSTGVMYIGEYACELVYRRPEQDDD